MRDRVLALLRQVASGEIEARDALEQLSLPPVENLPFATLDHHRALRHGFPEVIYGEGKTIAQTVEIAERLAMRTGGFLATRLT
jgi:pyridinium-3,5-biscarboxylic acid mononucleotide synthase